MFLFWLRQLPNCGDPMPASVPPPTKGRSSPTNSPGFPPSSFILLSFVWFCMFFSTVHVLLSALRWCSACTSVSEAVFLMCTWREMYSISTYSSAILFSCLQVVLDWIFISTNELQDTLGRYKREAFKRVLVIRWYYEIFVDFLRCDDGFVST